MSKSLKYMDIVSWVEEQISSGQFKPGDRFLSEAALGEKFGVSRQTIRRALLQLEQKEYICRIQGSGTYVAYQEQSAHSASRSGKRTAMTIGLVSAYMDDYIFPATIRGCESVLAENGYSVHLIYTQNEVEGEKRALKAMLDINPDGLLIWPAKSGLPCANLELYRAIRKRGIPLVFVDAFHAGVPAPYVAMDDERAGYIATQYLFDMGHRKIAGFFAFPNHQGRMRYLGHVRALMDAGITIRDDRIFWYSKENLAEVLSSQLLMNGLRNSTAVLCYNDRIALKVIGMMRQNGIRVPEDVSVAGIDNCDLVEACSLTSVAHPMERLGEAAAKLLLSMLKGAEGHNILFPPQLIPRSSVSPAP